LRVPTGAAEEEMLADYIAWLARDLETTREIGHRAAAHIAAHHGIDGVDGVAQKYWDVLKKY
jgi:hypothetical protein